MICKSNDSIIAQSSLVSTYRDALEKRHALLHQAREMGYLPKDIFIVDMHCSEKEDIDWQKFNQWLLDPLQDHNCCICMELVTPHNVAIMPCKWHYLHESCSNKWGAGCPLCRKTHKDRLDLETMLNRLEDAFDRAECNCAKLLPAVTQVLEYTPTLACPVEGPVTRQICYTWMHNWDVLSFVAKRLPQGPAKKRFAARMHRSELATAQGVAEAVLKAKPLSC